MKFKAGDKVIGTNPTSATNGKVGVVKVVDPDQETGMDYAVDFPDLRGTFIWWMCEYELEFA